MKNRFGPRARIDIEEMVVESLAGWTPPKWDDPVAAQQSADEMNEVLGLTDPEDMWTADGMIGLWSEYAPCDDNEARRRLASGIIWDIKEVVNLPGPRSVYRNPVIRKVATFLYASGITCSGGSISCTGRDPDGWVYALPSWRHVRNKGARMRPYVLWIERDWWECQRSQGWTLRGRHKPGPFVYGLCGHCCPWPCCGSTGSGHADSCVEKVFT